MQEHIKHVRHADITEHLFRVAMRGLSGVQDKKVHCGVPYRKHFNVPYRV